MLQSYRNVFIKNVFGLYTDHLKTHEAQVSSSVKCVCMRTWTTFTDLQCALSAPQIYKMRQFCFLVCFVVKGHNRPWVEDFRNKYLILHLHKVNIRCMLRILQV